MTRIFQNLTDHRFKKLKRTPGGNKHTNTRTPRHSLIKLLITGIRCCLQNPSVMKSPRPFYVVLSAAIVGHCLGLILQGFFFPMSTKANKSLEIPLQFPLPNMRSSNFSNFFNENFNLWLEILLLLSSY